MSKKSNNKKNLYCIEEEVVINLNSTLKINLNDLGLNYMNLNSDLLKIAISKYLDSLLRNFEGIEPIAHKLNVVSRNIKSRSRKNRES